MAAADQFKKVGIVAGLISVGLMTLGLAFTGGGRITGVEKDVESLVGNQDEDRVAIKEIATLVMAIKKDHDDDYKELKQDTNDAKLRDERMSTQYTAILSHMAQQTESNKKQDRTFGDIKVDIGKMQTKIETLIKDE